MTPKCLYLGQKLYQDHWINEDIFINRNDAREWKRREIEKGHQVKVIEYKSNATRLQQLKNTIRTCKTYLDEIDSGALKLDCGKVNIGF